MQLGFAKNVRIEIEKEWLQENKAG